MNQIEIGKSFLGKPLRVDFLGKGDSSFKIFIIAGQHGDEKYSIRAVEKIYDHFKSTPNLPFQIAILANANPDGFQNDSRFNAQSIDLNRDHLLLQSNETKAIHDFVRKWNPKVMIDVHNYPTRRRHLLKKHAILNQDIFVDVPTNLAVIEKFNGKKINEFISKIKKDLATKGFSCERYVVFHRSGKIRHSTLDVKDARNSLALRYGLFSIILEGRQPLRKEGLTGENRTILAQFNALLSMIDFLVKNKEALNSIHVSSKGELVPIKFKYQNTNEIIELEIKNTRTKKFKKKKFKNYSPHSEASKFIELPLGYGIPNSMTDLIKLLQKHGFSPLTNQGIKEFQKYSYATSADFDKKKLRKKTLYDKISDYCVFPTNHVGGRFLALLLEPQSKFGLHRFLELKLRFSQNLEFPIILVNSVEEKTSKRKF